MTEPKEPRVLFVQVGRLRTDQIRPSFNTQVVLLSDYQFLQSELEKVKAELAAEKAKAKELLEALESIYKVECKEQACSIAARAFARQAIAKYRQAEGQR